jgi:hypothetical protein
VEHYLRGRNVVVTEKCDGNIDFSIISCVCFLDGRGQHMMH